MHRFQYLSLCSADVLCRIYECSEKDQLSNLGYRYNISDNLHPKEFMGLYCNKSKKGPFTTLT